MSLVAKIEQDIKTAMLAKDELKLSVARLLKSAFKYAAIEKKIDVIGDADAQAVISRQIKQRRESADQFQKAGRTDLAGKESQEAAILESYLPKQMSDAELEALIQAELKSQGTNSKKDFGRMMKILTEKLSGRAEARRVSEILGKHLT